MFGTDEYDEAFMGKEVDNLKEEIEHLTESLEASMICVKLIENENTKYMQTIDLREDEIRSLNK